MALSVVSAVPVAVLRIVDEGNTPVALAARQAVGELLAVGGGVEDAVARGVTDGSMEGEVEAVPLLQALANAFVALPPLIKEALP